MQLPLEITFRGIEPSPALEAKIRERAEGLERFCDDISACRVVFEAPHQHRHKGNLYHVRIDITVSGGEIVVDRDPKRNQSHQDAYVAVRDAFNAARRQLQDYVRKRRQDVKHHEVPPYGAITALFPNLDYGTITTPDGREIYFHRNSVVDAEFDRLGEGMQVRFVETMGEDGPQASTVKPMGKHHLAG